MFNCCLKIRSLEIAKSFEAIDAYINGREKHKRLVIHTDKNHTVIKYEHVGFFTRFFAMLGFGKANFKNVIKLINDNQALIDRISIDSINELNNRIKEFKNRQKIFTFNKPENVNNPTVQPLTGSSENPAVQPLTGSSANPAQQTNNPNNNQNSTPPNVADTPPEEEPAFQVDRWNRRAGSEGPYAPIQNDTTLYTPGTNDGEYISSQPIPTIHERALFLDKDFCIRTIKKFSGISQFMGAVASLLRPGGNSMENAEKGVDIANVQFVKCGESYKFCLNFKSQAYAQMLTDTLKKVGLKSSKYAPIEVLNQYGLFRGQLALEDKDDIIVFIRHICQCTHDGLADLLDANKGQGKISVEFASELLSLDKKHVEKINYEILEKTSLCLPKEKIVGSGISQSIGATTSLLVPGLNSLAAAQQFKNIVNVNLDGSAGLSLNFKELRDAKRVQEALKQFGFSNMECKSVNIETRDWGTFKGSIVCKDAKTIVRYLRQICRLHPYDIGDLVNSPTFNKDQKFRETSIGKEILQNARKMLSTDTPELFGKKTLFANIAAIDFSKYRVNNSKMVLPELPDLPDEANKPLTDIIDMFKALQFDESLLKDAQEPLTRAEAVGRLQFFVKVLEENSVPNSGGLPPTESEKATWRFKMRLMMKHVLYLMRTEKTVSNLQKATILISLARGAGHCAGRFTQEIALHYSTLSLQSSNPLYINPNIDKNMPDMDILMADISEKVLAKMRHDVFERVCGYIVTQQPGSDLSHVRNKVMKIIGKPRAIPGSEAADYNDIYENLAGYMTKDWLLKRFDDEFTPEKIIEYFHENLCYGKAFIDSGMDRAVDFFRRHIPSTVAEPMQELLEEDALHLKKTYLSQMLQFQGFIVPIS